MDLSSATIHEWAGKIAARLPSRFGFGLEDLKQEIALLICEQERLWAACVEGHLSYVVTSVRNNLIDRAGEHSIVPAPRLREGDSDVTKQMKIALMHNQVSLNDEVDGYDYETILPCGKYEQADLWRKVRNERIGEWIEKNAPLLDFLLEEQKDEVVAPAVWNTKPIVRAYMGTDEVKKLLRVFGYGLTPDERLFIEESMFRKFLHAKKAKVVKGVDEVEGEAPQNFFMAM